MATRCSECAPLLALLLLLLSAAALSAAAGSLKEVCTKTPHPDVCMAVLSANQASKTADARGLAELAIRSAARIGAAVGTYARAELDIVKDTDLWQCLDECAQDIEEAVSHLDDSEGDGIDDAKLNDIRLFIDTAERDSWSCEESCRDAPPTLVKAAVLAKNNEFENIMRVTNSLIKQASGGAAAAPAPYSRY